MDSSVEHYDSSGTYFLYLNVVKNVATKLPIYKFMLAHWTHQ